LEPEPDYAGVGSCGHLSRKHSYQRCKLSYPLPKNDKGASADEFTD